MKKSISFAGGSQASVRFTAGVALTCLCVAIGGSLAHGDAAAGRAAYEKGDYARAMSEWQSAADRGDADAEFGLGSLYELGAGDLRQDYKRADYWYQKAAAQDYAEADYRLALIWAAGGENFPADIAEAYKWVLLAVDSRGVWGSLAADLKLQLDKVTSPAQQAEGRKRAAAWKEARNSTKDKFSAAATPPASANGQPGKPGTTGCPGWPFPTLPCTEQFPALPGRAAAPDIVPPLAALTPPRAVKPPIEELNEGLTEIECASLRAQTSGRGSATVSGTVPSADAHGKVIQLAERFFPNSRPEIKVDVIPPPLCRSLADFNAMRVAGLLTMGGMSFRLNNGANRLHEGEPMKIEVHSPSYAVSLRIDYFSLSGEVLHLWPNGEEPTPRLEARRTHVFGEPANGKVVNAGGAPFGDELITVTGTPSPVDLGTRAPVEQAVDYLRDLKIALSRANPSSETPNIVATLLVHTMP